MCVTNTKKSFGIAPVPPDTHRRNLAERARIQTFKSHFISILAGNGLFSWKTPLGRLAVLYNFVNKTNALF